MSFLLSYINEIESGRIVAGQELKSVLKRLKSDLNNPRYEYDEKPGQIRIEFIERFCKHTKSPFNGQPFKLELWEKAFLEAAYGFKYKSSGLRRFNEALLLIARKNGKTTFIAGIDMNEVSEDEKTAEKIMQMHKRKIEIIILQPPHLQFVLQAQFQFCVRQSFLLSKNTCSNSVQILPAENHRIFLL